MITRSDAPRARELGALTTLRFVAAVWVVQYHVVSPAGPSALGTLQRSGFAGVSLFFVLSGFVLAYNYPAVDDRRAFWRARAARIVPVYLLSLAIAIPLLLHDAAGRHRGDAVLVVLTTVTLTQAWYGHALKWNFPAWSVSVEAFLYLIYPLFLARLMRTSWRRALGVACGVWAVTVAAALAFSATRAGGVTLASRGSFIEIAKYIPLAHVSEFIAGILAARFFRERPGLMRARSPYVVAAAFAAPVAVMVAFDHLPYLALHDALLAPLFAALVCVLASVQVRARAPLALGRASYAMYLLHIPLYRYAQRVAPALGVTGFAAVTLYAAALIAIAVAVMHFYEEPLRRLVRARGAASEEQEADRCDDEKHAEAAA